MTDIVGAFITRLKANTTLCSSTYVGASPNQRVYRASLLKLPTFPCVTVHLINIVRENETARGRRYATARVQCTAYATTDAVANAISELIADDLNGLSNTLLPPYVVSVEDAGVVPDINLKIGYLYHRDFLVVYDQR